MRRDLAGRSVTVAHVTAPRINDWQLDVMKLPGSMTPFIKEMVSSTRARHYDKRTRTWEIDTWATEFMFQELRARGMAIEVREVRV